MTLSPQSNQHDSTGFTSGLLLGLVIGGAGGYLLSSDKGKELMDNLKESAGGKLAELADNPKLEGKLRELENTMAAARATLNSSSDSARDRIHQAAQQVAAATATEPKKPKNTFFRRGSPLK